MSLVSVAGSEFQFERPVWSLEWEQGPSPALPVWTLLFPISAAAVSIQVRQTAGCFHLPLSQHQAQDWVRMTTRGGGGLGGGGRGAWPGWGRGGGCYFINREAHQAGGVTDAPAGLDGAGKRAPNALRVWALTAALSGFFFVPTCLQSVLSQEARHLPLPALRGSEPGLHRPCCHFSLQAGKAGGQWSACSEHPE